jgi:hypothetical protein
MESTCLRRSFLVVGRDDQQAGKNWIPRGIALPQDQRKKIQPHLGELMLHYPEIAGSAKAPLGKPCIAFYKYDGSNLRFEWQPKKGWFKFGTRTQLFSDTHPIFGQAVRLFMDTMGDEIVRLVRAKHREMQRIVAFCEYFGPKSFAGKHDPGDAMELRLIDVSLYKKGFMRPRDFVRMFGSLPYCAQIIYDGNLNQSFIDDVRRGAYPVWEGVVAKGDDFMVKIKTDAYFKKLNEVYGTAYRQYWE